MEEEAAKKKEEEAATKKREEEEEEFKKNEEEYLLSIKRPSKEFIEEELQPMLDKLQTMAKENDFYGFLGMSPSNRSILDVQNARREKAVQCHPDHAETEEQKIEFAATYGKISNICQNYLLDEKMRQIYGCIEEQRKFYSKIATAQYKNLLAFHDRATKIQEFMNGYGPPNHKDLSLLQGETTLLLSISEAAVKNINPDWVNPNDKSDVMLSPELLEFLVALLRFGGIEDI